MTALTGETGAGKTLLIEALSLLLGGRADPSIVRAGSADATVEGRFVAGAGPDHAGGGDAGGDGGGDEPDDSEITLSRSVVPGGRSRAWVNGRMTPITGLTETGSALVELHGQHQHRSLIHATAQGQALDEYGQVDLSELQRARSRLRSLTDESASLGGEVAQRAREMDVLRYQIDEIESPASKTMPKTADSNWKKTGWPPPPPIGKPRPKPWRHWPRHRSEAHWTAWQKRREPWPGGRRWRRSRLGSVPRWQTSRISPLICGMSSNPGKTIPNA